MPALRARALVVDNLAQAELNDLHRARALVLSQQGERDWEAFIKLDPSNQIAWNNVQVSRGNAAGALWGLGRIQESLEYLRRVMKDEPSMKASGMIGATLAFNTGYLVGLEADAGNKQRADAAIADNRRLIEMAVKNLSSDSFGRSYLPELLGWHGFAPPGFAYGGYALSIAARDYEAVRNQARASLKRLEQLKTADATQDLNKKRLLDYGYRMLAEASYNLKDYAAADAAIRQSLEVRRAIPKRTLFDERDAADVALHAAMIAARQEKYSEAQQLVEPALKLQRGLYARKDNDDLLQHVEFAAALYASALAAPGQKTAQLNEAAALIDRLPPAMRSLNSVSLWRDRIAEEQKKHR
jgi:hypothetical protein